MGSGEGFGDWRGEEMEEEPEWGSDCEGNVLENESNDADAGFLISCDPAKIQLRISILTS